MSTGTENVSTTEAAKDPLAAPGDPGVVEPSPKRVRSTPSFFEPIRMARSIGLFLIAVTAVFLMMASDRQVTHGTLFGGMLLVLCAIAVLDFLGLMTGREGTTPVGQTIVGKLPGEHWLFAPKIWVPLSLIALIVGVDVFGYELLPWTIGVALFLLVPPSFRRPGLLVFVAVSAIYLPRLGTYSLSDPWETHYGEVAREILSRDDWISLWWAQEDWFWSKPILIFWSEALTMSALGARFLPDTVLASTHAAPEWALRLPIFVMAMTAVLAMYGALSRLFGKRAGAIAALVLATTPHFFMIAHQSITDMPFVANLTVAVACFIAAVTEDPAREVRRYRLGPLVVSAQHAVIGALIVICLPQVLYLFSRNLTLVHGPQEEGSPLVGFSAHGDRFLFGSAHNQGVVGNHDLRDMVPWADGPIDQPAVWGLLWLAGLVLAIFLLRKERRARALFMTVFYMFCGIAFMGKGLPGLVLPGAVVFFYLLASRRWKLLPDGQLRVAFGVMIAAIVGAPWYVAMYVRHGPAFTDRLLIHDHINRLAAGVHGDTGSLEYFIEQLGVALFPWIGLVPAALAGWYWVRTRDGAAPVDETVVRRRDAMVVLALWCAIAFTLFNAMITKFHHYIFPAVPPAALLVGILMDRMFGHSSEQHSWRRAFGTVLAVASGPLIVLGVAGLIGDVRGVLPTDISTTERGNWVFQHGWDPWLGRGLVVVGLVAIVAAHRFLTPRPTLPQGPLSLDRRLALAALALPLIGVFSNGTLVAMAGLVIVLVAILGRRAQTDTDRSTSGVLGTLIVGGATLAAMVGRDLSWVTDQRPYGYERIMHLFVYNYQRAWPDQFDYRPMLMGVAAIATATIALCGLRSVRAVASRSLLGVAMIFAAWCVNVYLVDLAPHWGQGDVIRQYYRQRTGPEEPLVAYQMNWKGENFYSGNRVNVFSDLTQEQIRDWVQQHRGRRAFFLTEHGRVGTLRGALGVTDLRELTTRRHSNKFVLAVANL